LAAEPRTSVLLEAATSRSIRRRRRRRRSPAGRQLLWPDAGNPRCAGRRCSETAGCRTCICPAGTRPQSRHPRVRGRRRPWPHRPAVWPMLDVDGRGL